MAQVTKNTIHYILAYAAQGKHFPLTVNELQQLAYLAGRQLASPVKVGGDERGIPPMPENVLADMQVTIDRLKMWAKGEAYYAPVNGYDDPGVKKATISDVRKSAGYFAKRLEESYFALRDFMFAMDQARAALSADGGECHKESQAGPLLCKAAGELPEGWQIVVEVENGYGGVNLIAPDGMETDFSGRDMLLSEQISAAIDAAIAAKAKGE